MLERVPYQRRRDQLLKSNKKRRELQSHLCNDCKFMASSSRVTTSSLFSRQPYSYDVFINFRGPDTRTNFVSLLYEALIKDGIQAYRDSEDLREGEEICPSLLKAIRGSDISIPVFSKNYAESKYCLMELAEIWECHLSNGQTILPVFIDVEPRDVRHQTESFEGPFQEHKRNYKSADVKSWKNALKKVGNLKGWPLKGNATIEDQLNLVQSIVQRVLGEIRSTLLDECKHPIGIDSHIYKLFSLLNIGSHDVRFVAICGIGGLGKTTIAKVIYNQIFRSFDGHSFLANVREEASKGDKGLISLQNQLLKDIFKRVDDVSTVSQGSKLIEKKLQKKKILLILDDVDDHAQLDVLAGGIHWFGEGSRVIIITRDDESLNIYKVNKNIQIYKLEGLNPENSLQLLSLYAFLKDKPPEEYEKLSYEIVSYAEGLPLSLEVLGSFLFGKDKKDWEDTIKVLRENLDDRVPVMSIKSYDDKVIGRLKISYDKLSKPAKTIFLDIACHFAGWLVEEAISIWEACELHPRLAIKELTQMHLLKIKVDIDSKTTLRMHDQLRYMGRKIVSEDRDGDPTIRTRKCSLDDISNILEDNKRTQMVEGILLDWDIEFEDEVNISYEDLGKMSNLRFLNAYPIENLNGDFSHLPSRLRWFSWHHCPLRILPINFYHKELVHLDLSRSRIKLAWTDMPQNKNKQFQKLKVLILCNCSDISLSPNFCSWFPSLQRLDLTGCDSLLELPKSICQMGFLESLILDNCVSFNKLPTSIGGLKRLIELSVTGTKIEELPDGVGQLEKLEGLNVSYCCNLVRLPTSMTRMRSLLHFQLRYTMVVRFPDDFSKLSNLEVLRMQVVKRDCMGLQPLSINMSEFPPQIHELSLGGYTKIRSLPKLPSTLSGLDIDDCISLQMISDLSQLKWLKELVIHRCESLVRLPDMSNLKILWKLYITCCENLEEIQGLEGTEFLRKLNVKKCVKLRKLSDLSNLKFLTELHIDNCVNLEEIHGLEGTWSLEDLSTQHCHKLRWLPGLSKLKRLRKLNINECENLEEIHLERTEPLKTLAADRYYKLTETTRKIHGQGRLLDNVSEGQGSNTIDRSVPLSHGSPILCVVFAFTFGERSEPFVKFLVGELVTIILKIQGYVRWGVKKNSLSQKNKVRWSYFLCSIRIGDIQFTNKRDIIYIHHFKGGNDWFGCPLESKDAIEELTVKIEDVFWHSDSIGSDRDKISAHVKLCKVLLENKESEQQMPNQQSSAMLVADFFRWSDAHDDDEEVEEEEDVLSAASNKKETCLAEEDKAPCVVVKLNDGSNQQSLDQPSLVQEKGKTSPSDNTEEEEETINATVNSYGGVKGPNTVPEEVVAKEEDNAADPGVCNCAVKAVCYRLCNCFNIGVFVVLLLYGLWRFYSSGDEIWVPPPT
ncbi:disease resistance protein RUN1-like [Macadamia integrifolia]|uniref:disease resistance protein RUN1-like n=1 Tax=Macadamia integrifolia TaxID=60698 RepID=UPI001C4E7E6A|nr:disease resistance protein RUN1-like [Macadamia integrifolia]